MAMFESFEGVECFLVEHPVAEHVLNPQAMRAAGYAGFRNLIERFFNNLKQFRDIATRYDKLESTFLGAVQLVAAFITLK